MSDNEFDDVFSVLEKFTALGRMGRVEGYFAMRTYRTQADRQVKYAEVVSQAMAARRRVIGEVVATVTAQVEAETTIQRLMEKRAALLQPQQAAISAPQQAQIGAGTTKAIGQYVSDQKIEEEALQAAVGYAGAVDKGRYWQNWEASIAAKKYPASTVGEIRQIAEEVVRRTGG